MNRPVIHRVTRSILPCGMGPWPFALDPAAEIVRTIFIALPLRENPASVELPRGPSLAQSGHFPANDFSASLFQTDFASVFLRGRELGFSRQAYSTCFAWGGLPLCRRPAFVLGGMGRNTANAGRDLFSVRHNPDLDYVRDARGSFISGSVAAPPKLERRPVLRRPKLSGRSSPCTASPPDLAVAMIRSCASYMPGEAFVVAPGFMSILALQQCAEWVGYSSCAGYGRLTSRFRISWRRFFIEARFFKPNPDVGGVHNDLKCPGRRCALQSLDIRPRYQCELAP